MDNIIENHDSSSLLSEFWKTEDYKQGLGSTEDSDHYAQDHMGSHM